MTEPISPVWINQDNSIWIAGDIPEYLSTVGIFRIMWHGQDDERVILYGYLPNNLPLFDLPDDTTLELRRCDPCGPMGHYDSSELIMRFTDCHIKRKWIAEPVILRADRVQVLQCHVELACKIEIVYENIEKHHLRLAERRAG